jgi:hypothetical protein
MNLKEKLAEKEQERQTNTGNSWRPEPGETIEGTIKRVNETTITEYGEQSFIELTTADGTVTVWCNSILSEQIESEDVKPGDHVAIKFLGLKKSKRGNRQYKNYILVKE